MCQKHPIDITAQEIKIYLKAFLCDQCGKPFRLYATLLRHKLRNHNKQNHKKCEFCSSTFHDNYKLKRHIRSKHSQEKPHHCPECGKSFARKDKLQGKDYIKQAYLAGFNGNSNISSLYDKKVHSNAIEFQFPTWEL